ncbi:MAG: PD40 domain-containing protein [Armatimonadetes bacterium]|nr:PD40 domain-containing protein [Armatimonadota bacterium]
MLTFLAVFVVASSLGQVQELPPAAPGWAVLDASWSADGTKLAYTGGHVDDPHKRSPKSMFIYVVNADGSGRRKLNINGYGASFTRDGKNLIIAHIEEGRRFLVNYDLSSDKITPLTEGPKDYFPACSPTSDTVAFNSDRGADIQIYTMKTNGKGAKAITHGPGKAYNPIWSMDGKHIVYFRELGDQKDQIYVIDADGSHEKHISKSDQHNYYPAFLPNGDISYTNPQAPNERRVIVTSPDGEQKSVWPYPSFLLRWSASGKAAFIFIGKGSSALYVSDADGKNVVKVSD